MADLLPPPPSKGETPTRSVNVRYTAIRVRLPCYGFVVASSLVDIGTPERYRKADEDYRR